MIANQIFSAEAVEREVGKSQNAACLVLKLCMSPQEALHESSVLHLQAQLIFYLHSFIFLLPVTN